MKNCHKKKKRNFASKIFHAVLQNGGRPHKRGPGRPRKDFPLHVTTAKAPRRGGGASNRIVKRACDEISGRVPKPMRRNHTAGGSKATGKQYRFKLISIQINFFFEMRETNLKI